MRNKIRQKAEWDWHFVEYMKKGPVQRFGWGFLTSSKLTNGADMNLKLPVNVET